MQLFCRPTSDVFDSFYRECSKTLPPISFRQISERPDLVSQGLRAASCICQDRIIVWLDSTLEPKSLERSAAHEISHAVLKQEGFPDNHEKFERETRIELAEKVCMTILDLEIERRLDAFGFDPTANRDLMKDEILNRMRGIKGKEPNKSSELGCKLVLDFLQAKILLKESDFEIIDSAYRRRFPVLRLIGDRLARIIKENGYSTAADSCQSTNCILEQLGLRVKFKYTVPEDQYETLLG